MRTSAKGSSGASHWAQEPAWRDSGEDPDYRFSLANERTFLAWIRTALGVLAAGVLMVQFSSNLHPKLIMSAAAVLMCLSAAVLSGMAYSRWRANEIAMRHKLALPHTTALAVLSGVVLCVCAAIAALLVVAHGFS